MRIIVEILISIAVAVGLFGAVAAAIFCWNEAQRSSANAGQFAIAGALVTGLLGIAIAIYIRPTRAED